MSEYVSQRFPKFPLVLFVLFINVHKYFFHKWYSFVLFLDPNVCTKINRNVTYDNETATVTQKLQYFVCPYKNDSYDDIYCCGDEQAQYCCGYGSTNEYL